jgi:hypothetical protein
MKPKAPGLYSAYLMFFPERRAWASSAGRWWRLSSERAPVEHLLGLSSSSPLPSEPEAASCSRQSWTLRATCGTLSIVKCTSCPGGPRRIQIGATRTRLSGPAQSCLRRRLNFWRRDLDDLRVRSEFAGLRDVSNGVGVIPFARVRATAGRVGGRIVRIELDRLVVVRNRAVDLPFKAVGIASVLVGQHVVRIALDHR